MESLEDRTVPAAFVPGSIQGQDGWSGGTIAIPATVDQAVAQPDPNANAHAGVGAWRVSNSTINGGHNGAFSGWPFSPGLAVTAGQPSSGAGADRFTATFFFKSANAVADGSNIEADLGSSVGTDRTSFLAITNRADADGGLQLRIVEPDGATGNFKPTQIVATAISRTAYHRIDIVANFIDGNANDTFQVTLDGVVLTNPLSPGGTGTTFGTFEGFRNFTGQPYDLTNRLFWRSGSAASAFGAFANNAAQGFFFDDVSYRATTQADPAVTLASYAATFEAAGATTTPVFVDDDFAGTPVGTDPDGAGPATFFGYDSFATIQEGVDNASAGGTVNVAAGTYAENVLVNKSVTLLGANGSINPNTGVRGPEAIVVPVTTDATAGNVFAVTASDVTIKGFTIDGNNPLLTGGVVLNGVDVDAANGVSNADTFIDGLRVENNIIQNLHRNGVHGDLTAVGGTPSGDNFIVNNQIDNLPAISPVRGRGVMVENNFYAEISGNVLTRVATGIQTDNYFLANPGAVASIANNQVDYYARGIFHNNHYQSASTWTISGNDITAEATATATNGGLFLFSIQSSVAVVVQDNDVTGAHFGIEIWNCPTTSTVTVSGGTLTDNDIGILVTNNDLSFGAGAATSSVISGVTILDSVMEGVSVVGDSTAVENSSITANGTGIHVTNGGSLTSVTENFVAGNTGDGILITATAGSVALVFNNDLSGNDGLAVNNQSATTVNAGGNWFGTNTAAGVAAELTANVDFSPWLDVGTDMATAAGFQGDFRVLHVSADSPEAGPAGPIQEGIDLASDGGTVFVEPGTYVENLVIARSLTLDGAGPTTKLTPLVGGVGITASSPGGDVIVMDLAIDGADVAVEATDLESFTLSNVGISGTTSGSSFTDVVAVSVSRSAVTAAQAVKIEAARFEIVGYDEFSFEGLGILRITTGAGDDTFDVLSFVGRINIQIDGGANGTLGDTLKVSLLALPRIMFVNIENVNGPPPVSVAEGSLFIFGTANADKIDLTIRANTELVVKVEGAEVFFDLLAAITGRIVIHGLNGDDKITVAGSVPVGAQIDGGFGNDKLIGGKGHDLLDGGPGNDTVNGGLGNDIFRGALEADVLAGQGDTDTLIGPNGTTDWAINGAGSGKIGDVAKFNTMESLIGGSENDAFLFGASGSVKGTINGRGGVNRLDYTKVSGQTIVNLSIGTATRTGGVANIRDVDGGNGPSVIVGDDQNNVLRGNGGRDILIGGGGADVLSGGDADDILIGGRTAYDVSNTALTSLINEWKKSISYDVRKDHLMRLSAGGANGGNSLTTRTVFDDGMPNVLSGEAGRDFFFANAFDTADQQADELLISL